MIFRNKYCSKPEKDTNLQCKRRARIFHKQACSLLKACATASIVHPALKKSLISIFIFEFQYYYS